MPPRQHSLKQTRLRSLHFSGIWALAGRQKLLRLWPLRTHTLLAYLAGRRTVVLRCGNWFRYFRFRQLAVIATPIQDSLPMLQEVKPDVIAGTVIVLVELLVKYNLTAEASHKQSFVISVIVYGRLSLHRVRRTTISPLYRFFIDPVRRAPLVLAFSHGRPQPRFRFAPNLLFSTLSDPDLKGVLVQWRACFLHVMLALGVVSPCAFPREGVERFTCKRSRER